jgi:NADPH-dependent 2,4-dienoyl-CoA reductase/sulfur reductase-like enzyme/rhodanese-related sulfurtransferase
VRIVIVGGVAAGASAATKARRVNEEAEIIMFEKGLYVSFANCGLPYYIGGDIPKKEQLLLVTAQLFRDRFNIDVRLNHEALEIDLEHKTVTVKNGDGIFKQAYDKLILAMGSIPLRPTIPGINLAGVYTVFTIDDVTTIAEKLEEAKSAVVIGGGFIGLETSEALLQRGIKVTLVERMPQLIPNFDQEFSLPVERHLKAKGLKIILGQSVETLNGSQTVEEVWLSNGMRLKTDMVVVTIGTRPQIEIARKAGIAIGDSGGIVVDATMQTSKSAIYAAGDIVESLHLVSGNRVRNQLAGSAVKQGRIAGANAAGSKMLFKGVLGTSIIKAGDMTAARTGLNEREALKLGKNYFVCYSPTLHHAGYYPEARWMICKLVVENFTGKILGAEIIGWEGVDKRIDVLATAIYEGLSVFDLEQLDLAYAPPYGAARDPVIMVGMIASNIIRGEGKMVTPRQLDEMRKGEDVIVVDCRSKREYETGHLDDVIHIPVDQLRKRYGELDKSKKIVLYCKIGYRGNVALRFLLRKGFDVYNLTGGYKGYMMNIGE